MTKTQQLAVPRIERIAVRITALERRLDHLERRLNNNDYSSTASAEYDRGEVEALKAGIAALRFVQEVTK